MPRKYPDFSPHRKMPWEHFFWKLCRRWPVSRGLSWPHSVSTWKSLPVGDRIATGDIKAGSHSLAGSSSCRCPGWWSHDDSVWRSEVHASHMDRRGTPNQYLCKHSSIMTMFVRHLECKNAVDAEALRDEVAGLIARVQRKHAVRNGNACFTHVRTRDLGTIFAVKQGQRARLDEAHFGGEAQRVSAPEVPRA